MVEASKETVKNASASSNASGYLGDAGKPLPLHPIVASQIAAFTAATAIGFGLATQMTGFMLGGMRDAVRNSTRESDDAPSVSESISVSDDKVSAPVEVKQEAAVAEVSAKVAKPAPRRTAAPKAAAKKPAIEKAVVDPVARAKPKTRASNLKRISGLGPKVEELLHKAGVKTFADIAAWNEADIARFDRELGLDGRIVRDDWIGQARKLSGN